MLLVDDEPMLLGALRLVLAPHYDVTAVGSPKVALELIAAGEEFDAIISDVHMPEMSGMAFYRRLLSTAPEQARRFSLLTAAADEADVVAFAAEIRCPVLSKPTDLALLRETVQSLTEKD